jgi:hypothetical protein
MLRQISPCPMTPIHSFRQLQEWLLINFIVTGENEHRDRTQSATIRTLVIVMERDRYLPGSRSENGPEMGASRTTRPSSRRQREQRRARGRIRATRVALPMEEADAVWRRCACHERLYGCGDRAVRGASLRPQRTDTPDRSAAYGFAGSTRETETRTTSTPTRFVNSRSSFEAHKRLSSCKG